MFVETPGQGPLPVAPPVRPTARLVLAAILNCLPEFVIANMTIWTAALAAIWSFGNLLNLGPAGYVVCAVVFGAPGLWATAETVRLAIATRHQPPADPSA